MEPQVVWSLQWGVALYIAGLVLILEGVAELIGKLWPGKYTTSVWRVIFGLAAFWGGWFFLTDFFSKLFQD